MNNTKYIIYNYFYMLIFITRLVGALVSLPFIALEAMIKLILFLLYFPIIVGIAVIYPIIKINKWDISWVQKLYIYSTTFKKGFLTARIYELWEPEL